MHTHTVTLSDLEQSTRFNIRDCRARIAYFQRKQKAPNIPHNVRDDYARRINRIRFGELATEYEALAALRNAAKLA